MKYPIIAIKDKMVYVFKNGNDLKYTSESLHKQGVFMNVIYIDSDLKQYRVKDVTKLGYAGFFGFNPFLKGRHIYYLEPEFKEIYIEFLKDLIIKRDRHLTIELKITATSHQYTI